MKELLEEDYIKAAEKLNCEVNTIKAVCMVEAPKGGFQKDGKPVILFEPYQFSNLTKGLFDNKFVTINKINYPLSINKRKKPWTVANAKYGPSSIQHQKLEAAKLLDFEAALKACSWGKFQIMGYNYKMCGHSTIQSFVNSMMLNEGTHLNAFVHFIQNMKLDDELRDKNWVAFAFRYNGPKQDKGTSDKSDDYSTYLEKAYKKLNKSST